MTNVFSYLLTSSAPDQKPCAASRLHTIRRRRERRDRPRLLHRHRLGETKPQRNGPTFQAKDCKMYKGRKVGFCVTAIYFSFALFCFLFSLSRPVRKRRRTWTTSTQTLLRRSPPSRPSMTPWFLRSTRRSLETFPSFHLNCWSSESLEGLFSGRDSFLEFVRSTFLWYVIKGSRSQGSTRSWTLMHSRYLGHCSLTGLWNISFIFFFLLPYGLIGTPVQMFWNARVVMNLLPFTSNEKKKTRFKTFCYCAPIFAHALHRNTHTQKAMETFKKRDSQKMRNAT